MENSEQRGSIRRARPRKSPENIFIAGTRAEIRIGYPQNRSVGCDRYTRVVRLVSSRLVTLDSPRFLSLGQRARSNLDWIIIATWTVADHQRILISIQKNIASTSVSASRKKKNQFSDNWWR